MKKLLEVWLCGGVTVCMGVCELKILEGMVSEAHMEPGILPVPKCQSGKLHNSQSIR